MDDWKLYRRIGAIEARPYREGEPMAGISVSTTDSELPTLNGGWIARAPDNPRDQWYINAAYFHAHYWLP